MTPRTTGPRRAQAGFSLVELMVALAIGMVVMATLAVLLVNVNRNNSELARSSSLIENGRFTMQLLEQDLSHAGYWGGFLTKFDDLSYPIDSVTYANDAPDAAPDPCLAYSAANWNTAYVKRLLGVPIQVFAVDASGTMPTIGTCGGTWLANLQPNTHVLLVSHAAACPVGSASDEDCTAENNAIYFQHARCTTAPYTEWKSTTTYAAGARVTLGDITYESVQASNTNHLVTDTAWWTPVFAWSYKLTAASNATLSNFNLQNRGCNSAATTRGFEKNDLAPAYKLVWHVYYVRNFSVTAGDGIPTLMRRKFKLVGGSPAWASADALIEGVEGFRVELGVDGVSRTGTALTAASFADEPCWVATTTATTCNEETVNRRIPRNRGDGNPDGFVQCGASGCTLMQLMNVTAVKLYVLARANTQTPGHADSRTYTLGDVSAGGICLGSGSVGGVNCTALTGAFKRHVYTRAVRLTNISMRRELAQ
jgi:type IV pilus assembly protein PilW